jgi:hypothetical protein
MTGKKYYVAGKVTNRSFVTFKKSVTRLAWEVPVRTQLLLRG